MRARIVSKIGLSKGLERWIETTLTIGRGPGNDLALEGTRISNQHARIVWDEAARSFFLEDLDSTNGTEVDGMPVRGKVRLEAVHVLTFAGEHEFFFVPGTLAGRVAPSMAARSAPEPERIVPLSAAAPHVEGSSQRSKETALDPGGGFVLPRPAQAQAPPTELDRGGGFVLPPPAQAAGESTALDRGDAFVLPRPASNAGAAASPPASGAATSRPAAPAPLELPAYRLEVRVPGAAPEVHVLRPGPNRIGRLATSDVVIQHETVSRQHAVLTVEPQRVLLTNVSQSSRTSVGGTAIQEIEIARGTNILFGDVEAVLS